MGITGGKMRGFLPSMLMPLLAPQILWIFTSVDFVLYLVPVVTVKVTLNLPGLLRRYLKNAKSRPEVLNGSNFISQ